MMDSSLSDFCCCCSMVPYWFRGVSAGLIVSMFLNNDNLVVHFREMFEDSIPTPSSRNILFSVCFVPSD